MTKERAPQPLPPLDEIEAYLFDWDGNGARSLHAGYQVIADHCATFGLHPTRAHIIQRYGSWDAALHFGLPPDRLDEYIVGIKPKFHEALVTAPLYPGFRDVLTTLWEQRKRIAIITAGLEDTIRAALEHHGLIQFVESLVTAEGVEQHKPHPEAIHRALGRFGIDPSKAIMFGDSYAKDIGAARQAGTAGVLFYPPEHHQIYDYNDKVLTAVPVLTSWQAMLDQLQ